MRKNDKHTNTLNSSQDGNNSKGGCLNGTDLSGPPRGTPGVQTWQRRKSQGWKQVSSDPPEQHSFLQSVTNTIKRRSWTSNIKLEDLRELPEEGIIEPTKLCIKHMSWRGMELGPKPLPPHSTSFSIPRKQPIRAARLGWGMGWMHRWS